MNNFSNDNYDLGLNDSFGLTKGQVDNSLKNSQFVTGKTCLICSNTAQYQIIPKKSKYNTVEIQDRGYICGHCLNSNNNINTDHYGLRELDK